MTTRTYVEIDGFLVEVSTLDGRPFLGQIQKDVLVPMPLLEAGERYVGAVGDLRGGSLHHVILLPGDSDGAHWQFQMDWARSIGGDLPSEREQFLLWARCRSQFRLAWYWANQDHDQDAGRAVAQFIDDARLIHSYGKRAELRARAIRRVPILDDSTPVQANRHDSAHVSDDASDAARYRYLRDEANEADVGLSHGRGAGYDHPGYGQSLDAAIDAAMVAQRGGGEAK